MTQSEVKFRNADDIVIPMWERGDMHLGKDPLEVQEILTKLTTGERAIHAVMRCCGEIKNGGFWQFFGNSTGILTYEAIRGFQLIGAQKHAALIEKAASRFPNEKVPLDWQMRCDAMNSMIENGTSGRIEELDKEFYDLEAQDPLRAYADRYIEMNSGEFINN